MPLRWPFVISASLLSAGCSPSRFAWHEEGATMERYRAAFTAAAGDRLVDSTSFARFVATTASTRVLWLGDHHRSTLLHRFQRELLEALVAAGRPLDLVLEAVGEQDEPWVAAHLAGRVDEATLRARVRDRWPGSWLDDPELDSAYYRSLLAFARRHRIAVHGLEPTPRLPLAERDRHIAARVRTIAAARPERLVVVLVGQSHLLGEGDVVANCGLPALMVGGEPSAELLAARAAEPRDGDLLQSDGGPWWFAALFAAGR